MGKINKLEIFSNLQLAMKASWWSPIGTTVIYQRKSESSWVLVKKKRPKKNTRVFINKAHLKNTKKTLYFSFEKSTKH